MYLIKWQVTSEQINFYMDSTGANSRHSVTENKKASLLVMTKKKEKKM